MHERSSMRPALGACALAACLLGYFPEGSAQGLYGKPGHRGDLPDPKPDAGRTVVVNDGEKGAGIPRTLDCDKEYFATIYVSQPTEICEGFNFTALYNRAVALANAFGDSRRCAAGCGPARVFQIGRHSSCSGMHASFDLRIAVVCPKGKPPTELDPPTTEELSEPTTVERLKWKYARPGTTVSETLKPSPACPSTTWIRLMHVEVSDCLASGFDFSPAVERAEAESQTFYERLSCAPTCKASPWKADYVSWDCQNLPLSAIRAVTVEVWTKLECKP